MADRIRYVNAASAGGDGTTTALSGAQAAYASLDAGEQAERTAGSDITAEGNMIFRCVGTTQDAVTVVFGAWTTDATHRVVVETPLADRGATPRTWGTDRYRLHSTAGVAFGSTTGIHFIEIRGLQIESARTDTTGNAVLLNNATVSAGEVIVEQCIIRYTGGNATTVGGILFGGSATISRVARNNIVYGFGTTAGSGIQANTSGTTYVYNNTVVDCFNNVVRVTSGTFISKNNLATGAAGSDFSGTMTETNDASEDATAGGTNPRINQTFTFVGAPDYGLSGSDAGARTFGVDLSADANFPFSDDVVDATRGATWDIGAHQVTAAADLYLLPLQNLENGFGPHPAVGLNGLLQG